jgi:hypothetical protein
MKESLIILVEMVLVGTALCGCRTSTETIISPPSEVDLISNSSFELDGNASLLGWTPRDTVTVHLVRTAPQAGGYWSLEIEAARFPGSFVKTTVSLPPGTHRYKFSLWGKHASRVIGGADLFFKHLDTLSYLKSISVADTSWIRYSVFDTLSTSAQDSLVINLSGGGTEIAAGETFFDLCSLEKLD